MKKTKTTKIKASFDKKTVKIDPIKGGYGGIVLIEEDVF